MKNYWLTSGFFSLLSNFAMLGFNFLTFLLLVRILPQEDFGIWVLYITVTTIAQIVRNGLTQNALVKFLEGGKAADYAKIASASFVLNALTAIVTFAVVAAIAGLLAHAWNAPILRSMLYLYGFTVLLETPLQFYQFLFMANLNFSRRFWSIISYNATLFGIILYVFLFKHQLELIDLPIYTAISCLPALILTHFLARPYFKLQFPIDKQWTAKLFHFGKYVIGTNFSSMLFNRVDLMMIGYFLNSQMVALYSVPSRIANYVEVPLGSISAIVFPQASMRIQEHGPDTARYLYERSVGVLLAIIVPIAVFMFFLAKPLVIIIAGAEYIAAVPIMRLFAVLSIMKPYGRQSGIIMDSLGKPKVNFYLLVMSLLINIILNWIFIIKYGVMGAIIATILAIAVTTTISFMFLKKMINVKAHHPLIYMVVTYRDVFKKMISMLHKKNKTGGAEL